MKTLNTNEKLDAVLKVLNHAFKENIKNTKFDENGFVVSQTGSKFLNRLDIFNYILFSYESFIDGEEIGLILEYLVDKNLAESKKDEKGLDVYSIRFEGRKLIEDGGFEGKEENIKIQANLSKNLSIWVAVGTVGVLIVEILKGVIPSIGEWYSTCCN